MGQTGLYRSSWRAERITEGARVFNLRPYSGIIEHGRRAAYVNAAGRKNIAAWAMRRYGCTLEEAHNVAWGLSRAMSPPPWGHGRELQPRLVMTGAIPQMGNLIRGIIGKRLALALKGGK